MSLCNDCRSLIRKYDYGMVSCEIYDFAIKDKSECKAYLSTKCKDKAKIKKNNKIVENMYLAECEDLLG